MKALIFKDQTVLDSRDVAKMVEKTHAHLTRDIAGYIKDISTNPKLDSLKFFIPSTYTDKKGEKRNNYLLTRQGCEFVANKMTGKKGNQFTAEYVTLFNEMKTQLSHPSKQRRKLANDEKAERLRIMGQNSNIREAKTLMKLADLTDSNSAREQLLAEAAHVLTGKAVIPFMKKQYYSAGQVGQQLGITANKVGRIANKLNLKAEQPGQNKYGRWSTNKSPYSPKEVAQWLYTSEAVSEIKVYHEKEDK